MHDNNSGYSLYSVHHTVFQTSAWAQIIASTPGRIFTFTSDLANNLPIVIIAKNGLESRLDTDMIAILGDLSKVTSCFAENTMPSAMPSAAEKKR